MLFIFKIIAFFVFMMFVSLVVQMILTVFKIKRRIKEQQVPRHSGEQQNYASAGQTNKRDIDAEYRVVSKE